MLSYIFFVFCVMNDLTLHLTYKNCQKTIYTDVNFICFYSRLKHGSPSSSRSEMHGSPFSFKLVELTDVNFFLVYEAGISTVLLFLQNRRSMVLPFLLNRRCLVLPFLLNRRCMVLPFLSNL